VDDQVRVGMADRVADLLEHAQPLVQRRALVAAVVGDRLAFDVFQRQVRQAVAGHAGVEQAGDVGMRQAREDLPFAGEAGAQVGVGQARAQQLQRDAALIEPIGARGQPDLAHAAFAEQALQPVAADFHARAHARLLRRHQRFGQEILVAVFQANKLSQLRRQRRIIRAQFA